MSGVAVADADRGSRLKMTHSSEHTSDTYSSDSYSPVFLRLPQWVFGMLGVAC